MNQVTKLSLALLILATSLFAQDSVGMESAIRHEARSQKRQVIALNISFKDSVDSQKFWSIYDDFEKQATILTDKSIELIKEYAKTYETMTGSEAVKLTDNSMALKAERAKILKKTYKKISKISQIEAARFVQIENRINLMVSYSTALELPIIMTEDQQEFVTEAVEEAQAIEAPAAESTVEEAVTEEAPVVEDSSAVETETVKEEATSAEEVTAEPATK